MAFKDESPEEPTVNAEIEPRRSQRSRISKSFGPDFIAYAIESEPQTFKEAMSTPEVQNVIYNGKSRHIRRRHNTVK